MVQNKRKITFTLVIAMALLMFQFANYVAINAYDDSATVYKLEGQDE